MFRVWVMSIRWPMPCGPPVQPVFTSHTGTSSPLEALHELAGVLAGWRGRNGAPNPAENVAVGSMTPISVPASLAV